MLEESGLSSEERNLLGQERRFPLFLRHLAMPVGPWPEATINLLESVIKQMLAYRLRAAEALREERISPATNSDLATFRHYSKKNTGTDKRFQEIDLSGIRNAIVGLGTSITKTSHPPLTGNRIWDFFREILGGTEDRVRELIRISMTQCLLTINCSNPRAIQAHFEDLFRGTSLAFPEEQLRGEDRQLVDAPAVKIIVTEPHVLNTLLIRFSERLTEAMTQNENRFSNGLPV